MRPGGHSGPSQLWCTCQCVVFLLWAVVPAAVPAAVLPPPATRFLPGGIPKLVHQVYLSGRRALEQDTLAGKFKEHWRMSCQMHNPGWRHILWDRHMAEALLEQHYPWFLNTFRRLPLLVLRGDAIRVFILHAYGGLYLDMDTECYTSVDASLSGHSLVLQAEAPRTVNNAQMASVARHPFWTAMQQHLREAAQALLEDPERLISKKGRQNSTVVLLLSGPLAQSETVLEYLRLPPKANLSGTYPDEPWAQSQDNTCDAPGADCDTSGRPRETTVRIYGQRQWFEACEWNQQRCPIELARCTPVILGLNAARLTISQATSDSRDRAHGSNLQDDLVPAAFVPEGRVAHFQAQLTLLARKWAAGEISRHQLRMLGPVKTAECVCDYGHLVGAHHFTGTWMRNGSREDSLLRIMAAKGVITWMATPHTFVEVAAPPRGAAGTDVLDSQPRQAGDPDGHNTDGQAGQRERAMADSEGPAADSATPGVRLMDRALWPLAAAGRAGDGDPCHMLSVTQFRHPKSGLGCCYPSDTQFMAETLDTLVSWAGTHHCKLSIITDLPPTHPHLAKLPQSPSVKISQHTLSLPHFPHPAHTHHTTSSNNTQASALDVGASEPTSGNLNVLLDQWQQDWPQTRTLDMMHLTGPLDVPFLALRDLQSNASLPRVLLVDLPVLHMATRYLLAPWFNHLYQTLGYQGYHHYSLSRANLNASTAPTASLCVDCFAAQQCNTSRCIMSSMRIGLVRRQVRLEETQTPN